MDANNITVSKKEYRALVAVALAAKSATKWNKEPDHFKFMIDSAFERIDEKYIETGLVQ